MSRLTPLFKVESFRNTIRELLNLSDEQLEALRVGATAEFAATTNYTPQSDDTLRQRALTILYEAAARDGISDVEGELRAAFSEESGDLGRLIAAITPDDDAMTRLTGIEERDAYLPILTAQRLALDLRVTDGVNGTPVATPFVTVRLEFDSTVAAGMGAVVFQMNLAELEPLERALSAVRERASKLITGSGGDMSIPGWGHGLSDER